MANPAQRAHDAPTPGNSFVQSFARGLEVIRAFSAEAPTQTLSEVAARSGLSRAGARRILLTLQTLGYVDSDGRHFRLTPRILDLGYAYLSSMPLWNLAGPLMERLTKRVRESCSAAVLDGTDVVYVMRVHSHKIMSDSLGVGSRLPAYCCALGRVLLAGLPDEQAERLLRASDVRPRTRHTVTTIDGLMARVRQTRTQGWCLLDQELEEGLLTLAAPILNSAGETVAALNVSARAGRARPAEVKHKVLPELLDTAHTISALLRAGGKA